MAFEDSDSLESLLNRATNPANRDEDWELFMAFCDQVNKELEGPQVAVRLLAHKIQSPQEKEAIFALTALEACVKNCKKRFHQEIGKFRFLNEIIKVVSPKYLGNHTTDRVKSRCIEILYSWSQCLKHEPKINEAYQMLKRQGIVKQDPTYTDRTFEGPAPERPKNTVFEDDEKSKLLSRLLKSKHPEDLQAANRLIKNMVKQDAERMEKKSRRQTELETVGNNVKLLTEMLEHFYPDSTSAADKDLMKELYENLEKERPNLFRLASDTDEKDNEGINAILKANDEVLKVMTLYKKMVDGEDNGLLLDTGASGGAGKKDADLVDLLDSSSTHSSTPQPETDNTNSSSILDDQLMVLDSLLLHDVPSLTDGSAATGATSNSNLDALGDIFSSTTTAAATTSSSSAIDSDIFGLKTSGFSGSTGMGSLGTSPASGGFTSYMAAAAAASPAQTVTQTHRFAGVQHVAPVPNRNQVAPAPATMTPTHTASGMLKPMPPGTKNQRVITGILTGSQSSPAQPAAQSFTQVTGAGAAAPPQKTAFDDLDALGQSLLQSSLLPNVRQAPTANVSTKVPLNQMQKPASPTPASGEPWSQPATPTIKALAQTGPLGSPIATPTGSAQASPKRTPAQGVAKPGIVEVQSLSDLFVPLETVKPGSVEPLTAYDKNGMKIVIHFGKDTPRPDVIVMVVSSMSTNTSAVKNFTFQAAVPKMMRVKLQPPSATDLPAFNPILPTAAITQVMLLANPQKERIRLKFKISYAVDSNTVTDVGEVINFPVQ